MEHLNRTRVRLLYQQNAIVQSVGLINAAIYLYFMKDNLPLWMVLGWGTLKAGVHATRLYLRHRFKLKLKKGKPFDARQWENIFALGTLASGLAWSLGALFLIPARSLPNEAFLGFVLAGTTAGAAVAYSTSLRATYSFLFPPTLTFAAVLLAGQGRTQILMAVMDLLYLGVLYPMIRKLNQHMIDSIKLRYEKDHLVQQLRATRDQVTESAKMAALGAMAAGVAHEINNPLGVIKTSGQLIQELAAAQMLTPEQVRTLGEKIDRTVDRIARIVTGLKTFAREGKADQLEIVSLNNLIQDTLTLCQARFKDNGVQMIVPEVKSDVLVQCRAVEFRQVLLNLLNNAFDAVKTKPMPWIKIEVSTDAKNVSIAVSDSGEGIPEDIRNKIMDPFFTTKKVGEGAGLGLSIAQGLIRSHGGSLHLDGASAHTRFVMTFPQPSKETLQGVAA